MGYILTVEKVIEILLISMPGAIPGDGLGYSALFKNTLIKAKRMDKKQIAYSENELTPGRTENLYLYKDADGYTLKIAFNTIWDKERSTVHYYSAKTYPELLEKKIAFGGGYDTPLESLYNMKGITQYLHENDLIPEWRGKQLSFQHIDDSNMYIMWKKTVIDSDSY